MSQATLSVRIARVLLAATTLVVGARLAQLTFAPADRSPPQPVGEVRVSAAPARSPRELRWDDPEAELALLYRACPASANFDLTDVIEQCPAPQVARQTSYVADTPAPPSSPQVVPRIRYPKPVGVRVAARADDGRPPRSEQDDWLVDPDAWYSAEDREKLPSRERDEAQPSYVPDTDAAPTESDSETPAAETAADQPESLPSNSEFGIRNSEFGMPPPQVPGTERLSPPASPAPSLSAPADVAPPAESRVFAPPPGGMAPHSVGHPPASASPAKTNAADGAVDPHLELFAQNCYPSARECGKCHEKIYEEWSTSTHAYAFVSPMFHKFEQKLSQLTQGTIGYFCYRCHSPVGTAMGIARDQPLWELPEVAREGVTCIACHRVQYLYGKNNGERRIEKGDIFAPVLGGIGGDGVAEVIDRKDHFKVKTSPEEKGPGQDMHLAGIHFPHLGQAEFCAPCHQVAVHPGIKLEVVWEQYRASPACKKGIRCQDCHMGREPGLPSGFEFGPAAEVGGKTVNDHRRHSNHNFYGPGYSIAHPGVFPFHKKADRWTIDQWLAFDWRAGWGTDEFEDQVADGVIRVDFPPCWKEADDRYDAREIIEDNLKKIAHKREIREQVMENGSHVDGPFFDTPPCRGQDLRFHFVMVNKNEGHNLLTASLGAQPQLWANVALIDPRGQRVWESGYTDSYGDVADIHSADVRQGRLPFDWQLFNLQTMFLITGVKGTDREFMLPVNIDFDQLPFIRPGNIPISVTNHPPFIRMESRSLAPLGSRKVPYRVPGELLSVPGVYRLAFRTRSRAEPIYFMRFVGATIEMQRAMNEGMIDVHPYSTEFLVR